MVVTPDSTEHRLLGRLEHQSSPLIHGAAALSDVSRRQGPREPAGHVIVDFGAFDARYEEDEPNGAHPRDPFHRVLHSCRRVRVQANGILLADSTHACLLFEPPCPFATASRSTT